MFATSAAKRMMPCTALLNLTTLALGVSLVLSAAVPQAASAQTPTATAAATKPAASPSATAAAKPTASATAPAATATTPAKPAASATAATPAPATASPTGPTATAVPAPTSAADLQALLEAAKRETAPSSATPTAPAAPAPQPSSTSISATTGAATTPPPAGLAGYAKILLILGVFVLPLVFGNYLSKSLRLPDQGLRFYFVLFAVFAGLAVTLVGWPPKLGIDLRGGVILVYEVKPPEAGEVREANTMEKLIGTIKKRLDPSNISEIVVRPFGSDKVEVIVPSPRRAEGGSANSDQDELARIKYLISTSGALEFRIAANAHKYQQIIDRAREQQRQEDVQKRSWSNIVVGLVGDKQGPVGRWVPIKPDSIGQFSNPIFTTRVLDRGSKGQEVQLLVVIDQWNVTGAYLNGASSAIDEMARPAVDFRFNFTGGALFEKLTQFNLPQNNQYNYLTIILDGIVQSAPRIQSTISERGQITGEFTQQEVDDLAEILTAGGLPASLDPIPLSEQVVSATLGEDTIRAGVSAMLVATLVVVVFMVIYYRFAGLVANVALILNVLLTVGFMIMFNAAFTLSGLAGLALTVGMAVDANVLIYERMREELSRGATLRMAIRNGFDRASITIIDANITTLITAVVLYMIGTDQIKGFAVTLTVGLLMNLFTAITVSRLIFDVAERNRWISNLKFLQIMSGTNYDFIGKRFFCYGLSIVLLSVGLVAVVTRGQDLLNIDFTGGVSVVTVFDKAPAGGIAEVRKKVESALPEATVQQVNSDEFAQGAGYKIVTSDSERAHVEDALKKLFPTELARYRMTVDKMETLSGAAPAGPGLSPPANSSSAVEPRETLDDAGTALAAAEPFSDGITETLDEEDCQSTPAATGTKPAAGATPPAAAPSATKPAASATPSASPSATAAPKPTATAAASAAKSAATTPAATVPAATVPAATVPAATVPGVNIPASAPVAPAAANPLLNLTNSDPFAGGTLISLTFSPPLNHAKLEELTKEAVKDAATSGGFFYEIDAPGFDRESSAARGDWQLRLAASRDQAQGVINRLQTSLETAPFFPSTEVVGAAVAGGAKQQAVIAMTVSLLLVMAYVWFRFQNVAFGIAAIAALLHDVLFTVGCLALSKWLAPSLGFALVEPFKIDLTIIAAILTIIGYSINDTIVIFDRIREVRGKSPTISGDLINICLNQTLSRTILTSMTVFLVVVILYIWGGPGIHGFAFALVVGTISGTYSTIYVASPLLLWLYRKPNAAAAAKRAAPAAG